MKEEAVSRRQERENLLDDAAIGVFDEFHELNDVVA
jgi:hypothetical protein